MSSTDVAPPREPAAPARHRIAVLTGGGDRPYALGLAFALLSQGVAFDFIASDDLESAELRANPLVRVLNLRGDQDPNATRGHKVARLLRYYVRLLAYAQRSDCRIFHILWNNKFELLDRTVLLMYYRLLRRRLVLTVHNVNIRVRDGNDGPVNRLTLRLQYRLADHLFVHTEEMRAQLERDFGVPRDKSTVIPFGINDTVPRTGLTRAVARERLAIGQDEKVLLFFGNIAPYKGLQYLLRAMLRVWQRFPECRLVIAGRPKGPREYWDATERELLETSAKGRVTAHTTYVADEDVEAYFMAADVAVLPYSHVYQSGVLFLGYGFGLPAIVTDVGSLRWEVDEGETGLVCRPEDAIDLADTIERFFASDMYLSLEERRPLIRDRVGGAHSWSEVASLTCRVYAGL